LCDNVEGLRSWNISGGYDNGVTKFYCFDRQCSDEINGKNIVVAEVFTNVEEANSSLAKAIVSGLRDRR